jgi:hypothetical protein
MGVLAETGVSRGDRMHDLNSAKRGRHGQAATALLPILAGVLTQTSA